ncbi:MAG: hypothetical protein J7449_12670, partial [Thermomicrobium sp.]|uniref:hypothetical protein n=1 Tax=Thermomicrobium sp. TaxID=1969469 RepID=UPI001B1B4104
MSTNLDHSPIGVTADYDGHVTTAMARPALEQLNAPLGDRFRYQFPEKRDTTSLTRPTASSVSRHSPM